MTDQQIVQFILHRAKTNSKGAIVNPKLIIFKNMSSLLLGIKTSNCKDVFMLRFLKDDSRALFRLNIQSPEFEEWKKCLIAKYGNEFIIDYDINVLPEFVKHYVSYAIIEVLKAKGMGFDLFSISSKDDPMLIYPNESYEEIAIETDLLDFDANAKEAI